ncbi:MAG: VOC family protein [Elusimicrobiaceae bacterium]
MKFSFVTIYVEDIGKAVAFYKQAFSLRTRFVHESGLYVEMETGSTVLSFSQTKLAETIVPGGYAKASLTARPANMQLGFEPDDVKAALERALDAGAVLAAPYEVKPWGWESALIRDPEGNLIELAKKL